MPVSATRDLVVDDLRSPDPADVGKAPAKDGGDVDVVLVVLRPGPELDTPSGELRVLVQRPLDVRHLGFVYVHQGEFAIIGTVKSRSVSMASLYRNFTMFGLL